jgi:hypothetical protein
VQLRSFRHASTQEDGQTIRRKHAPAAGKSQIHARMFRSESGRHALPCVYPLRTHFAHASPLAYCCPYACNQRMCHIACVVAQVETQPLRTSRTARLKCAGARSWMYRIRALTASGTSVTGNISKAFEGQHTILRGWNLLPYKKDMNHQIL